MQCFDLEEFLTVNKTSVKFVCPMCGTQLPFSELIVDPILQEIIEESKRNDGDGGENDKVVISSNGTWNLENHEKLKAVSNSSGSSNHRRHTKITEKTIKKPRGGPNTKKPQEGNSDGSTNNGGDVIVID